MCIFSPKHHSVGTKDYCTVRLNTEGERKTVNQVLQSRTAESIKLSGIKLKNETLNKIPTISFQFGRRGKIL